MPKISGIGLFVAIRPARDRLQAASMAVSGTNDESGWADAIRR
jgi:hypothetical protein